MREVSKNDEWFLIKICCLVITVVFVLFLFQNSTLVILQAKKVRHLLNTTTASISLFSFTLASGFHDVLQFVTIKLIEMFMFGFTLKYARHIGHSTMENHLDVIKRKHRINSLYKVYKF